MRNIIFYLVLIIAAIGLVMNLDAFIFSIVRMLISFAVIAGIILSDLLFHRNQEELNANIAKQCVSIKAGN